MFPLEPRSLLIVFADRNPEVLKNEDTLSHQHGGRPGVCHCSIRPVAELYDHPANPDADNLVAGAAEVT
jgi:hypothetical protein